jgi:hypothetical protein
MTPRRCSPISRRAAGLQFHFCRSGFGDDQTVRHFQYDGAREQSADVWRAVSGHVHAGSRRRGHVSVLRRGVPGTEHRVQHSGAPRQQHRRSGDARLLAPQAEITSFASDTEVAPGTHFAVVVDVQPGRDMHVYAPGVTGYRPVALIVDPQPWVAVAAAKYPSAEDYFFKPLNEHVPVYRQRFRIVQDIVNDASTRAQSALKECRRLRSRGRSTIKPERSLVLFAAADSRPVVACCAAATRSGTCQVTTTPVTDGGATLCRLAASRRRWAADAVSTLIGKKHSRRSS